MIMDKKEKSRRIKSLLKQFDPELLESRQSDLEGFSTTDKEIESTNSALETLVSGTTLEALQIANLEAIIFKKYRPAVFVVEDIYQVLPHPWQSLNEQPVREKLQQSLKSIGRIELPNLSTTPYGGTGFVVGEGLIMTNRHVAEIFARGLGLKNLNFKVGQSSTINFRREILPSPEVLSISITEIVMIHPYWDMALLRVEGLTAEQVPLTLSTIHPDDLLDRNIAVIGYPAQDPRNDIDLQNEIFGGVYDVKRFLPGKMQQRRVVDSFHNEVNAIIHDASTLGGNSGSAVIDASNGEVLALHFAGAYLDANFAVPSYELARDSRVIDAGVNFNGVIDTTEEWAARWAVADQLKESPKADLPIPDITASVSQPIIIQTPISGKSVTLSIPLDITLSVGKITLSPNKNAVVSSSFETEGMFGGISNKDLNIITKSRSLFKQDLLNKESFSWETALAMVSASYLSYSEKELVRSVCLTEWGFNTCDFIQAKDTECFIASTASTVLVSFRGTAGIKDWIRDASIFSVDTGYGTVHTGFHTGFKQASEKLERILSRVNARSKKVILTGHSLGGALATIAAAEWEGKYPITAIYTFGQPAVGRKNFQQFMNTFSGRFFRTVNDDDIVPKVPPSYRHVGKLKKLGSKGEVITEAISSTEEQQSTNETMSESEFQILQDYYTNNNGDEVSPQLEGFLPSFSDHSSIQYMKKIISLLDHE